MSPIVDASGAVIAAAEIGRDITARKLAEQRVAYLAYHDDLTGLPNRLMFAEHLDLALARAQRHGRSVAVLYVDLDDFKHTNDTYGHQAGDQLLRQVARRLERATRATDLVARHGGDEFLVLAADLPAEGAREIAQTIADHVEQALRAPAAIDGATITAGGSVGIALYPDDATARDELMRRADAAMYRSKELARRAPAAAAGNGAGQVPLTARMQLALERGEFVLHYQPILRLEDMRMVGGRGADPLEPPGGRTAGAVGVHPPRRAHRPDHRHLGVGGRRGVPRVASLGARRHAHPGRREPADRPLASARRPSGCCGRSGRAACSRARSSSR